MIRYTCHACGIVLDAPMNMAGQDLQCPSCHGMTIVPARVAPVAGASLAGVTIPLLISAIFNVLGGLLWLVATMGCAAPLSIALWILCGFEFALYAKAERLPPETLGRHCLTIGIVEIIVGLFNLPALVCGILVIVNSSRLRLVSSQSFPE